MSDQQDRAEKEFQRRRGMLVEQFRADAFHAFQRWVKVNPTQLDDAATAVASRLSITDITVGNVAEAAERLGKPWSEEQRRWWFAWVARPELDHIGAGVHEGSPVDALLRFCCWLDAS